MKAETGRPELRAALGVCRSHFAAVFFLSIFVNLLMLTGPIFMLQTYDRVLTSRSLETLVALLILITALFAMLGILEFIRGRVLARAGARFQTLLDSRVFTAVLRRSVSPAERARPNTAARDLESIRGLLAGPAPFALFDVPWTPLFLAVIFLFHPILGWIAVAGGLILVALTAMNQIRSKDPNAEAQGAGNEADNLGEEMRQNAEAVRGLGMRDAGMSRWQTMRQKALGKQILASDRTASYGSASKALRFYLQSLMLAAGAWLVLRQEISPGMMIASSILMGRALAPIEQAIGQWSTAQRAQRGWKALVEMLEKTPMEPELTQLPPPKGHLRAEKVGVVAPGDRYPVLRGVDFTLAPGQALGVIGPSGAGKTTLAKVLVGIWPPAAGTVRLDGAALDQWPEDALGEHIGYLPQDISLFAGTVAQNIARMSQTPDDAKIVEAAKRAGAHDLLLSLPNGYDTEIGAGGGRLSGGQRQRVALARALYGDPPLLVLDEPNANLDAQGEQALVDAIRDAKARGRTVVIMAHRPSAIAACDLLLMIDKGVQVDLGPRDEVLKKRTRNVRPGTDGGAPQPAQQIPPGQRPAPLPAAGLAETTGATSPLRAAPLKPAPLKQEPLRPAPLSPDTGPAADGEASAKPRHAVSMRSGTPVPGVVLPPAEPERGAVEQTSGGTPDDKAATGPAPKDSAAHEADAAKAAPPPLSPVPISPPGGRMPEAGAPSAQPRTPPGALNGPAGGFTAGTPILPGGQPAPATRQRQDRDTEEPKA